MAKTEIKLINGKTLADTFARAEIEELKDKVPDSGANGDWNAAEGEPGHILNKPFWKEAKEKNVDEFTVTTALNQGIAMCQYSFDLSKFEGTYGGKITVYYDGVKYDNVPFDRCIGDDSGAFASYPFSILPFDGLVATKTEGEHTFKIICVSETMSWGYLPYLVVSTAKGSDRKPYLTMEQVDEIENAFDNGIPIKIHSSLNSLAVELQVTEVTNSYIVANGIFNDSYGTVNVCAYSFARFDGTLTYGNKMIQGTIVDNGSNFPIMYIRNKYYKIDVDGDGKLTATEYTG